MNLPPNERNTRFYKDILVKYRPALTFAGFDNGGDNKFGLGLRQVIEKAQDSGSLENKIILQVSMLASNKLWKKGEPLAKAKRHIADRNSCLFQSRSFIALLTLVLEENLLQLPGIKLPSHSVAMEELWECFHAEPKSYPMYANEIVSGKDRVKWSRSLMSMARGMDYYLALENAYSHYGREDSQLLAESEKKGALDRYGKAIKEILKVVDSNLGIGSYISGNWSLKMWVAAAYSCLGAQNRSRGEASKFNEWFGRGLRRAGPGSREDKRRYWTFMTTKKIRNALEDGQRTWAEGPYYLHFALQAVIPFWHAIRLHGYLDAPYYKAEFSDPFHSGWFLNPLEWLADVATPEGGTPPFDDGNRKAMNFSHIMSWHPDYGNDVVGKKMNSIYHTVSKARNGIPTYWKGIDWNLYLLQLAIPKAEGTIEPALELGNRTVHDLQEDQLIIRREIQGEMHYICLHGEGNLDSIRRGEGHEQPDQLQLLYYVGEDSVIMDAGYDKGYVNKNSSWNRYRDHNVMAYERGDSGLSSPNLFKKVSHAAVDYLYLDEATNERLAVLKGHLGLRVKKVKSGQKSKKERVDGQYSRTVLFVADSSKPYLIDINSVLNKKHRGTVPRLQMRYHVDSSLFDEGPEWLHWAMEKKPDVFLYFQGVEYDRNKGKLRIEDKEVRERFKGEKDVKRLTYLGPREKALTTVAVFQSARVASRTCPDPLLEYKSSPLTHQLWKWDVEEDQVTDILIVRSPADKGAFETSVQFQISLPGATLQFVLRGMQDVGFARCIRDGQEWKVDIDYMYGLEVIDRLPV